MVISSAWMRMSVAWPRAPPLGWCTMILELGRLYLIPWVPAASSRLPMLQAWPTHHVLMGGSTYCIVS